MLELNPVIVYVKTLPTLRSLKPVIKDPKAGSVETSRLYLTASTVSSQFASNVIGCLFVAAVATIVGAVEITFEFALCVLAPSTALTL